MLWLQIGVEQPGCLEEKDIISIKAHLAFLVTERV